MYQRGPNLEVDFRYTNFFLASDPPPPPPPWYSINQPLSKGLGPAALDAVCPADAFQKAWGRRGIPVLGHKLSTVEAVREDKMSLQHEDGSSTEPHHHPANSWPLCRAWPTVPALGGHLQWGRNIATCSLPLPCMHRVRHIFVSFGTPWCTRIQ